jgi:hypothetical protein
MIHSLEELYIFLGQLREWVVDTDVRSPPVLSGALSAIPVVFSDHGELCVERNADPGIAWKLKGCSIVERTHNYDAKQHHKSHSIRTRSRVYINKQRQRTWLEFLGENCILDLIS